MTLPIDETFDFDGLIVLDLANNHQGQVEHGREIIRRAGAICAKHGVRGAAKFQFRDLDTFVHPTHRSDSDNKHIPRFLSTRLSWEEFRSLREEVRAQGMEAICTPFDEASVERIVEMGFDIIKVASCSAADWPLIETVARTGKPVIVSTGGLELAQIDDLNSFFEHRQVDFAMMHCVSIYPTPAEMLELNQIDLFRRRYPGVPIGWSTHEEQDALAPAAIAIAKGAQLMERHVGLPTDEIKLNAYSSNPEQLDTWIGAIVEARRMCGRADGRPPIPEQETAAIAGLQRGIFAKDVIPAGTSIPREAVYFAIPIGDGQLPSSDWREGIVARTDIAPDAPLTNAVVDYPPPAPEWGIKKSIHAVKALLNEAGVQLNTDFEIEYSHHYGIDQFDSVGAVLINVINRSYCKKIVVQLPGQVHPQHYHARKEETFQVLHGVLNVVLEGRKRVLHPGETCLIQPGMWHAFWTDTGCVFEEISTRHYNDDSFYKDAKINEMKRSERKTVVSHWGRFELIDKLRREAAA